MVAWIFVVLFSMASTPASVPAITGLVVDENGRGIPGASIVASPAVAGRSYRAESGADGSFSIENVSPGVFRVRVERRGYAGRDVAGVDAAAADTLTIRLRRGGVVYGTVTGIPARLYRAKQVMVGAAGPSLKGDIDEDGNYRVEDVPEGPARVEAILEQHDRQRRTTGRVNLDVRSGEEHRLDLQFSGGTVRGRITKHGKPYAGAKVTYQPLVPGKAGKPPGISGTEQTTLTDAEGSYEIDGIDEGRYLVEVQSGLGGHAIPRTIVRCDVLGSRGCDVDLTGAPLSIEVREKSTGEPIHNAEVNFVRPHGPEIPRDYSIGTDRQGAVRTDFIAAGEYKLRIGGSGFISVERTLSIRGNDPHHLVVELDRAPLTKVRVFECSTEEPLPSTLLIDDSRPGRKDRPIFKADGVFEVNLAPGRYRLVAVVSGYAPKTVDITLPTESEVKMAVTPGGDLRIENSSSLQGRLEIQRVDGFSPLDFGFRPNLTLEGQDTVLLQNQEPGEYWLVVRSLKGWEQKRVRVCIRDGDTTVVRW